MNEFEEEKRRGRRGAWQTGFIGSRWRGGPGEETPTTRFCSQRFHDVGEATSNPKTSSLACIGGIHCAKKLRLPWQRREATTWGCGVSRSGKGGGVVARFTAGAPGWQQQQLANDSCVQLVAACQMADGPSAVELPAIEKSNMPSPSPSSSSAASPSTDTHSFTRCSPSAKFPKYSNSNRSTFASIVQGVRHKGNLVETGAANLRWDRARAPASHATCCRPPAQLRRRLQEKKNYCCWPAERSNWMSARTHHGSPRQTNTPINGPRKRRTHAWRPSHTGCLPC